MPVGGNASEEGHDDGTSVWTYVGPTPGEAMFVLLGLYEGCGWTGPVDPAMDYPRDFEVDYIRVYRRRRTS